jgi:hypothetical protein
MLQTLEQARVAATKNFCYCFNKHACSAGVVAAPSFITLNYGGKS